MTTMATEKPAHTEPVGFNDVNVGDTLAFYTKDNGFGGTGNSIRREGVVTSKTDKTITLHVVGSNPFIDNVWRNGKGRDLGRNARIRRDEWNNRVGGRVAKGETTPSAHVVERDRGTVVWALWVYDVDTAEQIKRYGDDTFDRLIANFDRRNDFEVIAAITRSFSGGARGAFSGWALDDEPICKRKSDAMRYLREAVTNFIKAKG